MRTLLTLATIALTSTGALAQGGAVDDIARALSKGADNAAAASARATDKLPAFRQNADDMLRATKRSQPITPSGQRLSNTVSTGEVTLDRSSPVSIRTQNPPVTAKAKLKPPQSTSQPLTKKLNPQYVSAPSPIRPDKLTQFRNRGWSQSDVDRLIKTENVHTSRSINRANNDAPSTAFFRADGHHVVRENTSGVVFHASDTKKIPVAKLRSQNDPKHWAPDGAIEDPYLPSE